MGSAVVSGRDDRTVCIDGARLVVIGRGNEAGVRARPVCGSVRDPALASSEAEHRDHDPDKTAMVQCVHDARRVSPHSAKR